MWPPCHKSIYFYLVNLLDWDYSKTKGYPVMLSETPIFIEKEVYMGPESSSELWKW